MKMHVHLPNGSHFVQCEMEWNRDNTLYRLHFELTEKPHNLHSQVSYGASSLSISNNNFHVLTAMDKKYQ